MSTANPSSDEERHIRDIREGLIPGPLGPQRHVRNLERALDLLSDQLYQKPTHFLLELVQNADDNDFRSSCPTITFTYENSRLRVDCNEIGFSKANVEAICQIGQSTKAGNVETTRYIGEKGIGFKSVFKVADKVWISSNGYTFMFDKAQPLGMIAPIWEAFPQVTLPGFTSILLEFSPSYDQSKLVTELKSIDPRMLIFLQKLRGINICVKDPVRDKWISCLRKSEKTVGCETTITLTQDLRESTYRISRHRVENMPSDPKREGQKKSEILIAFPMLNIDGKELDRQQVYAFLPIRDYGFKFLLQGDFLLSASREDILSESPWNKALRDCFVDALIGTVKNSHSSFLHYNWPLFLPDDSVSDDFFQPARRTIIQRLKGDLVVRNSSGLLSVPRELMQIPEHFKTTAGSPLLSFKSIKNSFISDKYGPQCLEPLERLGVKQMDLIGFVESLQKVLTTDTTRFREQTNVWHSEFARHLLAALWKFDTDKVQWKIIRELPIIPLENNEWISAAGATEAGAFFPPESEDEFQPEGIGIKLVARQAASDQSRASLYKHLDVPTISQLGVCHYISNSLCREGQLPRDISNDTLVSQTLFLFKAGWRNPSGQDLWFQDQTGARFRGSCLYLQSSSAYSTFGYFQLSGFYLSKRYFDAARKMEINVDEFKSWLEDCWHIWEIPRLVTVTTVFGSLPKIEISWEIKRLAHINPTASWINLLRDNFRKYSMFFDLEEMLKNKFYARKLGERSKVVELEHEKFLESIGKLNVRCKGNQLWPLKETYLPHAGVIEDTNGRVPLVDVPDPEHPDWHHLKRFGLGTEPNLKMYLRCLERLKSEPSSAKAGNEIDNKVARYLEQIQARYMEDTTMVKQHFTQKDIIRVPPINSTSTFRWLKSGNCLWDGGDCFRILPVLKRLYPGNETLFSKVLNRGEAKLVDLYTEATYLRLGDDIEHITEVFREIEKRLRADEADPNNYFGRFALNDIFPIASAGKKSHENGSYDKMCRIKPELEWYIADRQNLYHSFSGLLSLLALNVGTIQHLKKTVARMKLDRYRLSRCAKSRAEINGASIYDQNLSQDMARRVPYMLRLIPTMIPIRTKRRIAKHLRSLKVFLADHLIQEWSVTMPSGQVVPGRPYQANVVFVTEAENKLQIFLSRNYLARSVCKNDIVQHFADFCEIRDNTHLLNMALWESLEEVKATFQNYGIPDYDPLIDSDELPEEHGDEIEDAGLDPNNDDVRHITSSDKVLDDHNSQDHAKGFQGLNEATQKWVQLVNKGHQGTAGNANGHAHGGPWGTVRLVCPHCTRDQVSFAEIEVHSIFGTLNTVKGKKPEVRISNVRTQPSDGFPSFVKIMGSSSQTTGTNSTSVALSDNGLDLQFKGEQFFSTILTQFLGNAYQPNSHWTSVHRSRDGHTSFQGTTGTHATFTLPDSTGTVTSVMLREHPDLARLWVTEPPTWHFEVKTAAGSLDEPFYLTNAQFDRARTFSTASISEASQIPRNISVLVRVFNAGSSDTPEAHLYRDPWKMFLSGELSIKADTMYRCCVRPESGTPEPSEDKQPLSNEKVLEKSTSTHVSSEAMKPPPPYSTKTDQTKSPTSENPVKAFFKRLFGIRRTR